jgi:hypothetical protein
MGKKHFISTDKDLNPQLREEVSTLRGSILGQAEKKALPEQFSVVPHPDEPCMIITNNANGKSYTCGLFAYGSVREALNNLL